MSPTKSDSRTVYAHVDGVDGDGNPFHYSPGQDVSAAHAEFVTNPAVFVDPDGDDPTGAAHSQTDHYANPDDAFVGLGEDVTVDELVGEPADEFDQMERPALEAEADARGVSFTKTMKDDTLRDKLRENAAANA